MNYYKRHIGDYMRDASHLSLLEHGVYVRLMDVYYTHEQAIQADQAARLVGARSKAERDAVARVLAEFFDEIDGQCHQQRCDEEIAAMRRKAATNREVGKRGGRPRKSVETEASGLPEGSKTHGNENPQKTQTVISGLPDETLATSHKPIQIPSVPNGTGSAAAPAELIFGYGVPMLVSAGTPEKQARSFLGALRKRAADDQAVIDALQRCAVEKPLQPIEWLAAALPVGGQKHAVRPGRHAGFSNFDYREGVTADGALA